MTTLDAHAAARTPTTRSEWNIHEIVGQLRQLRAASLLARQRVGNPVKLPNRKSLAVIVEKLCAALFPHRLSTNDLAEDSVDFFVGHTLDQTLAELTSQVAYDLKFAADQESSGVDSNQEAARIVGRFASSLPSIRELLEGDIQAAFAGDPAAGSLDEVLACYPGVNAVAYHRLAHMLFQLGAPIVARIIAEIAHSLTGIDIHPGARIGGGFFIDHGTGVVIGETAVIGDRVRLYHGVTLGAKRFAVDENGVLVKGCPRHPIVEDDVVIYAGATILGRITIGSGSVIGGNVWLTQSVPPGSVISQAKLLNEAFDGGSGI